jgi:hypothetical protein
MLPVLVAPVFVTPAVFVVPVLVVVPVFFVLVVVPIVPVILFVELIGIAWFRIVIPIRLFDRNRLVAQTHTSLRSHRSHLGE